MTELGERVERLETAIENHREIIASQQQTITAQRERIDTIVNGNDSEGEGEPGVDRRTALKAGGLLGLLGVGATSGAASPSGQVGTDDQPLDTLYTAALDGPLAGGEGPITAASTDPDEGALALRDGDGALAVAPATEDGQAVTRGQAVLPEDSVDWSGDHDFASMPAVGGDSIVESDSNSDGEWVRFADGTQLCWDEKVQEGTERAGGDMPQSFVGNSYIQLYTMNQRNTNQGPSNLWRAYGGSGQSSAIRFEGRSDRWYSHVSNLDSDGSTGFHLFGIGRWK